VSPPISSNSERNSENDSDDPLALTDTEDPFSYLAHALTASAPSSYHEAKASGEWEHWKPAMDAELAKMDQYRVWEVVDRQPNMRVVGAPWVCTRKIDGNTGKPTSYKARWVAKGYSQREGIDFNDLYAAVAHKDTIRVFNSLVNHLDLECDQVDIKAAFLNGDREETIYLSPPEGSDIPANKVLHLRKSLYGLKQSPRCFNKTLNKWLKSQVLTPSKADPCLYSHQQGNNFLMLSIHVDDQLIACNHCSALDGLKRQLNSQFECSDPGPIGCLLWWCCDSERGSGGPGQGGYRRIIGRSCSYGN
jgi:hypothetical protein